MELRVVKVSVGAEALRLFFPLFQEGITVEAVTGFSVKAFLCDQIGLEPRYVEERISTVFLDGMPVDDIDAALLHDGALLALSAAMPGLVGATLRRGGYYAPMRSAISYRRTDVPASVRKGRVKIKLFNTVMEEAGPQFLRQGIVVPAPRAAEVLRMLMQRNPAWIDGVAGDASPPAGDSLPDGYEEVLLIVEIRDSAE